MVASKKGTRKMKSTGDLGGFTIIEVVLVLAIAGLIFLMVFIAFPTLQRSQRDTTRRTDLGRMSGFISSYQGNNGRRLPSDGHKDAVKDADEVALADEWQCSRQNPEPATCFIRNYIVSSDATKNTFTDPDGWAYGLDISTLTDDEFQLYADDFEDRVIYVIKKATCDGEKAIKSNNARDYVIMYRLEGAGTYCASNG